MPQFEVANALPQIVWLALIFAILYLTLSYGALPKVDKMATKRAQVIGDDLAHAESAKAQAEATSAAYEASLAEHQRLTGHSGGAFLPPTGQRKSSSRRRGRRR